MKIRYSKLSRFDIKEIADFIKTGSPRYAKLEIKAIEDFISKLKTRPLLGKPFEKARNKFTRLVIFKNYLIIYTIVDQKYIDILTIHHHSRSFSRNTAIDEEE